MQFYWQPDGRAVAKRPTSKDTSKPQALRGETEQPGSHDSIIAQPTDDSQTAELDSQTTERPQWEQKEKNEILQQQVKHLQDKVDKLTQDCKKLLTDKVMAIRDKEVGTKIEFIA